MEDKNVVYYDTERQEYVTLQNLREEFDILLEENETEYGDISFTQYVNNCLCYNGGTLEEVNY